ncbi:MAG: BON domain-containing protein [Nanoarchaeota archaeon]
MGRPNEEIKQDIVDNLFWDSRIDPQDVEVKVNGGEVTLEGTVPTYIGKNAARENAIMAEGVYKVNNNVKVLIPAEVTVPEDNEIKRRVSDLLLFNPIIDSTKIIVFVKDGEVTLEGNVSTYLEKIEASTLPYNIIGVWNVIDRLTVVPTKAIGDEIIADQIMAVFSRKANINEELIEVRVNSGIVTLSGDVYDWLTYLDAENIARYTAGVKEVQNQLEVVGQ